MAGCNIIFLIKEIRGPAVSPDENLNVYRAVKKQPFFIIISSNFPRVDFHTATVTASLRYQTDTPPGKDVMFIKANPLEYTTKVVELQSEENISHNINSHHNNSTNTNNNNTCNTINNANTYSTPNNTYNPNYTCNNTPNNSCNNNSNNTYSKSGSNMASALKSSRREGSTRNTRLELEVETKLLTLSSQHQGSYFYIHFQLRLMNFGQEIYCELDTPPIQVISKKGHNHTPIQRRKPASDIITAALNRIEESEYQKTDWLSQLCINNNILRENMWQHEGTDIPSILARMCYSYRNVPSQQRALAIAMELSKLGSFEKNVIDYLVANLRIN